MSVQEIALGGEQLFDSMRKAAIALEHVVVLIGIRSQMGELLLLKLYAVTGYWIRPVGIHRL